LSNGLSFEGPGIKGELPHHADALGRGRITQVIIGALVVQPTHADDASGLFHEGFCFP
jgi:hypothetical protein